MWADINGYEGLYRVSDKGEVFSQITNKVLRPSKHRCGYLQVVLSKNGQLHYVTVHRLVAKAFIPNPENKRQVNHKDGNKENNSVDNLEWYTSQENIVHCIYVLNRRKVPVVQCLKDGTVVKIWDSIIEASQGTGIKAPHIWRNAQRIRPSTGGFIFSYAGKTRFN